MNEKELKKCHDWWEELIPEEQREIMTSYYQTDIYEDADIKNFFGDMPDKYQLEIYKKESKKEINPCDIIPTEEEKIDNQGDIDDDFNERSKGLERLGPMTDE